MKKSSPARTAATAKPRLVFKAEVCDRVGLTFVSIWGLMRTGEFPLSRKVGSGKMSKIAWTEDEIADWIANRPRSNYKPLKKPRTSRAEA